MYKGIATKHGDFSRLKIGTRIASGGAGAIYNLVGHPKFVFKKYHTHSDLEYYEQKISAMMENEPSVVSDKKSQLTWPICSVYEDGHFVGYIMRGLQNEKYFPLEKFINKKAREINGLSEFLGYRLTLAHNLCSVLRSVHEIGCFVVDLKPANCLFHKETLNITLIDTDGFSISNLNGQVFSAKQFTPEYIAPELCNKPPSQADIMQDNFALAVIIFKLLNNGIHPFQASMKTKQLTIQEMVRRKKYAYALDGSENLIPSRHSVHDYLPRDVRVLFDKAFKTKNRPSSTDWLRVLTKYMSFKDGVVDKCKFNADHLVLNNVCGQCKLERQREDRSVYDLGKRNVSSQKVEKRKVALKSQNKFQPKTIKTFKTNLLSRSLGLAIATHFSISFLMFFGGSGDTSVFAYFTFKSERLISTFVYLVLLFIFFYSWKRGNPKRDCPSCGSYAGALKYLTQTQKFVGFKHTTKRGDPDRRYKNNPKLYSLETVWKCEYCENDIKFKHQICANPTKQTPIIAKKKI